MAHRRIDWPLYVPHLAAANVATFAADTSATQLAAAIDQARLPDPTLGVPEDWSGWTGPDTDTEQEEEEGGGGGDSALAIGLGVGLGVGIPAAAASLAALLWWRRGRRTVAADALLSVSAGPAAKPSAPPAV